MLKVETALSRMWAQAVCAALEGGSSSEVAVEAADEVALSYNARFNGEGDKYLGAGMYLHVAVKHYERSALIGKVAVKDGATDLPLLGKIKDFSEGTELMPPTVLIAWDDPDRAGETEAWVASNRMQIVMKMEPEA